MRLLFEGGFYSRAAFIRGRLLFEGGFYWRLYGIHPPFLHHHKIMHLDDQSSVCALGGCHCLVMKIVLVPQKLKQ